MTIMVVVFPAAALICLWRITCGGERIRYVPVVLFRAVGVLAPRVRKLHRQA